MRPLRRGAAGSAALPDGVLNEPRELSAESIGIPRAQIDYVLRAVHSELQRLVGTTAVQIIFHDDSILVAIGISHDHDGLQPYRPACCPCWSGRSTDTHRGLVGSANKHSYRQRDGCQPVLTG
jgi:hypothetical protein